MSLLLLDLDNTLVDRAAAFRRWAEGFTRTHMVPANEVDWLVDADRDGYEPRDALARSIQRRFRLNGSAVEQLVEDLRWGMVEQLILDAEVPRALCAARDAGWAPVVVTNGTVEQQERKIRRMGLNDYLAGWVISESAGMAKPDRRIFELAADFVGVPLGGAWMIGDSAHADIGGAHRVGIESIWLHRGRTWEEDEFAPSIVLDSCPAAIDHVCTQ
ncbi:HAD family hydrolase [Phytoactinopolyspora endophytica]|uniref:HAD family hydrolase n=1 Tax=Phytoactinopolyspora endophytica TaxID=1642495 RepID=UPI00101C9E42|nr:HAD family hydrolase [Phytoactinopolyspora endophytica]